MFKLTNHSAVLVVVDMQKNLLKAIAKRERVVSCTAKLIESFHIFNMPIIHTEQFSRLLGPTIKPLQHLLGSNKAIHKMNFNCCLEPDFMTALLKSEAKQIVLCGIETHICVLQTALSLQEMGYQIYLAADACGTRKKLDNKHAIEAMLRFGVQVGTAEMIIFQILQTAESKEYKKILKLVAEDKEIE